MNPPRPICALQNMAKRSSHGNNIHGSNEKKKQKEKKRRVYYHSKNVLLKFCQTLQHGQLCPVLPNDKQLIPTLNTNSLLTVKTSS